MVESIPKHLLKKVSIIYSKKGLSEFKFQDVVVLLGYDARYTGQIISDLVSAGWIIKKREEADKRVKTYRIKDPREIMKELGDNLNTDKNIL
jgi:hypothetical protein